MTTITLVRHGETDWNNAKKLQGRENIPLNENGISQAKCCAHYLKQFEWDILLSSPLDRARDTAAYINEQIHLGDIYIDENLVERNYGKASGLTVEEKQIKFPDNIIPEMETRSEIVQRASETLERIAEQFPNKRLLIVTHGGFINGMLYHVSGGEIGTGKTLLKNTSITRLTYSRKQWALLSYNECAC